MSQEILSSETNKHNVCEAFGCFAQATIEIAVKVGQQGIILLQVCRNCVNKFEDGEKKW